MTVEELPEPKLSEHVKKELNKSLPGHISTFISVASYMIMFILLIKGFTLVWFILGLPTAIRCP